jgi:hypothetical protein
MPRWLSGSEDFSVRELVVCELKPDVFPESSVVERGGGD